MAIKDAFLPEFDHELKNTRAMLERVPESRADWKPHPKSMSLGDLAAHLANIPFWGLIGMTELEFDLEPPGGGNMENRKFESTAKLLADFDEITAKCRAAVEATDDAAFTTIWTLKHRGAVRMTFPRTVIMRSFVLNHLIHHRGQLSVYLRMLDVPVPPVYGPTADDKGGF